MTDQELLRKTDMALSDLATAGVMNPTQSNTFFRKIIAEPTIIRDARTILMPGPKYEINKIGLGTRMFKAANQGTGSSPLSGEEGTRALSVTNRTKPSTSKIQLDSNEIIAEINIPYEVLEDSIEGGDPDSAPLQDTLMALITQQAALDLEEFVLLSDTASGDAFLALTDGVLKRATTNTVNHAAAALSPTLFANMIKALPVQYHRLLGSMRFYSSVTKEIDYRTAIAQRQSALGDSVLTGTAQQSILGVRLEGAALMPNATLLLTDPRNIIVGIQRKLRMEFAKDARERMVIVVLTMRVDTQIEEEDMVVKGTNVG